MKHFILGLVFVEEARKAGGKVLIHCMAGVNRSVALTVAYVMHHKELGPISAAMLVADARGSILFNKSLGFKIILLKFVNIY